MKTKLLLIFALLAGGIAQAMEPEQSVVQSPIERLPNEDLLHIFSYVVGTPRELSREAFQDMKDELGCFAATCTKFRALTYESTFHKRLAKYMKEKDAVPQNESNQTEGSFLKRGRIWERYLKAFSLQTFGYYLKPPTEDPKEKENTPSPTLNIKKAHRARKLRRLNPSSRQERFEENMKHVKEAHT